MCLQHLDMRGRPGLLRTVLEAQETRGLTRSDDISRLLPSEVKLSPKCIRAICLREIAKVLSNMVSIRNINWSLYSQDHDRHGDTCQD